MWPSLPYPFWNFFLPRIREQLLEVLVDNTCAAIEVFHLLGGAIRTQLLQDRGARHQVGVRPVPHTSSARTELRCASPLCCCSWLLLHRCRTPLLFLICTGPQASIIGLSPLRGRFVTAVKPPSSAFLCSRLVPGRSICVHVQCGRRNLTETQLLTKRATAPTQLRAHCVVECDVNVAVPSDRFPDVSFPLCLSVAFPDGGRESPVVRCGSRCVECSGSQTVVG